MSPALTVGLMGALLAALLAIHMLSRRLRRIRLSQSRFLSPSPQSPSRSFALSNPFRSPPLYPRLAVLALVAAALFAGARGCEQAGSKSVGLWLFVDSSLSMSTQQGSETRMAIARDAAREMLAAAAAASSSAPCVRLTAFDMERRDLVGPGAGAGAVRAALAALEPRTLGSNASLPLAALGAAPDEQCAITHLVVLTDLPIPTSNPEPSTTERAELLWIDVSEPSRNVGIERIEPIASPVDGRVRGARIHLRSWGRPVGGVRLIIEGPAGRTVLEERVAWIEGTAVYDLDGPQPGLHRIRVTPGGSYGGDDEATLDVPPFASLPVDWRLDDREWLERLGWVHEPERAALRVTASFDDIDGGPTLVVGRAFEGDGESAPLGQFQEADGFAPAVMLLEDVDLDVAEGLALTGIEVPADFTAALTDARERTLVAYRERPRAVYVPGLPHGGDQRTRHLSTLLFANGLRWVLAEGTRTALHTLTSPTAVQPQGTRLTLHPGEGVTDRDSSSAGETADLRPRARSATQRPVWPLWLALACFGLVIERGLFAFRGSRWL